MFWPVEAGQTADMCLEKSEKKMSCPKEKVIRFETRTFSTVKTFFLFQEKFSVRVIKW